MIGNLSLILSFIITLIGVVRFRKLTMPFKLLAVYLLYAFFLDLLNIYITEKYKTNAFLIQIQTITNYILYSLIYYYLFKNESIKKLILILIIAVTVFFCINALWLEPFLSAFPSNVNIATQIIYVILSLLLFKQMLLYPNQINIIRQSIFWYNSAILFFATTMFLNLGLMNYYSVHHYKYSIIIYFWYTINIISNFLLGIAVLTDRKNISSIEV